MLLGFGVLRFVAQSYEFNTAEAEEVHNDNGGAVEAIDIKAKDGAEGMVKEDLDAIPDLPVDDCKAGATVSLVALPEQIQHSQFLGMSVASNAQ